MSLFSRKMALTRGLVPMMMVLTIVGASAAARADTRTVELVKVVPGRQVEFMRWMAQWDEVYKQIGLSQPQWFRNISGDKWDFVIIWPTFTPTQEAAMEKVGRSKGLEVGFAYHIKYWDLIAESTDTVMEGPTTPEALLKSAGQ